MTQTSNRLLDEFAKMMTDAAGVATGMRREVDTIIKSQMERFISEMDLVSREEFDVMKDIAIAAREEADALKARIAALEAACGVAKPEDAAPTPVEAGDLPEEPVKLADAKTDENEAQPGDNA